VGVDYQRADLRDAAVDSVFTRVRPDVVFHLGAQLSSALAEVEVARPARRDAGPAMADKTPKGV
jgi:nucleoside-diphosphate-sugar epimerase